MPAFARRLLALSPMLAILACGRVGYTTQPEGVDGAVAQDVVSRTDVVLSSDVVSRTDVASADGPPMAVTSVVSAGQAHTCAVHGTGLFCWGDNTMGDLGNGATTEQDAPVAVSSNQRWAAIGSGANHTCGIDDTGALWCWGQNDLGQLATGDTMPHATPTRSIAQRNWQTLSTSFEHTCAIAGDGSLWCWGRNTEGELGQNDPFLPSCTSAPPEPNPLQVGSDSDWIAVSAGDGATCGIRAPGTLWCWGRNSQGQLGLGSSAQEQYRSPQQVGTISYWQHVSIGPFSTCGIQRVNNQSTLLCWGDTSNGAVGVAPEGTVAAPIQITDQVDWTDVQVATFHACGLHSSGALTCWGRNVEGQLGLGRMDPVNPDLPTQVGSSLWAGVTVGHFSTCAWNANGDVYCTGQGSGGQLGLGSAVQCGGVDSLTLLSFP